MNNKNKIAEEEKINLDKLINKKERILNKLRYASFSKYAYWLLMKQEETNNIFYVRDLMKYAHITYPVAYMFFRDLTNLGFMRRVKIGNMIYFKLTTNDGHIKLRDYLPYIIKTLKEYVKK